MSGSPASDTRRVAPISRAADLSPGSSDLLRILLAHASDAVIVRDAATREVIQINERAEFLYGYRRTELASLPPDWPAVPPTLRPSDAITDHRAIPDGGARPRWHQRRDSAAFPAEVAVTRFELDGRALDLETVHDLSDPGAARFAMEARLGEAEALLELASALEEPGGLDPLLDSVVESVVRFAGADFGGIGQVADGQARILRLRDAGAWRSLDARIILGRLTGGDPGSSRIVTLADLGRARDAGLRALARRGVRSLALAPVHERGGRLVALLIVGRRYGGLPYDERQLALLTAAARHAGAAIERSRAQEEAARLHQETLRHAREVEALLAATSALNAAVDPDAVVRELVLRAATLCHAESASITFPRDDTLVTAALRDDGVWTDEIAGLHSPSSVVTGVLETGVPYRGDQLAAGPATLSEPDRRQTAHRQLSVPLVGAGGQVIGVLSLFNEPSSPFTEHDEILIAALAVQGAIALERARSREELADSIVALSRSEERFRSIVQNVSDVITLLGADGAVRYQSPSVEPVLGYQASELVGRDVAELIHPEDRARLTALIQPPLGADPRPFALRVRHRDGSWRSLEAVATNLLDDPSVRAVVVHSRDITERIRQEEGRRFLAEVVSASTVSLDYQATLDAIARLAVPFLGDWCAIHMTGVDGSIERVALATAEPSARALHDRLRRDFPIDPSGDHPVAVTLRTGQPQFLSELTDADHQRLARSPAHLRFLRGIGTHTWISAPLSERDTTRGVISIGRTLSALRFTADDLLLVEELSRRVSLSIENARLYRELAERKEQLEDLVGRLLTAHEEERRRAAYEVHDGVAQVAAGAHQHLQAYFARHRPRRQEARDELEHAVALAQQTVREARRVVGGLRPTVLDDFGLATALRHEVEALRADGWRVRFQHNLEGARLPAPIETAMFRVAQEAIANARKHAGATRLLVVLRLEDDVLRLLVRDWGRGIQAEDARKTPRPGERVGIAGIHERVSLLGGSVKLSSLPGAGVRLLVSVPVVGDRWSVIGGR